jgi:hypothetical protein
VSSRVEPVGGEHRLAGVGAGTDDVGAAHGLLERVEHDTADLLGQRPRMLGVPARHADLVEVAHPSRCLDVRLALDSRSEHGQHPNVCPRQRAR